MGRLKKQDGATLVLIVGVVATLAILAAAMVALSANVQRNTSQTRTQAKAFNVAESGLDAGQAALWATWPSDAAVGASLGVDPTTFHAQFDGDEFPAPDSGQFVDVEFYDDDAADNQPPPVNPGMNTAYNYDKNANGYMWVVSRGATGTRAARVQAMVKKVTFDMLIREGVALFTEGQLQTKGTGNQPVVGLDEPATAASVYALGGWFPNGNGELEGGISMNPDTDTELNDVFPDDTLAYLIEAATAAGKYYQTQAEVPAEAWESDPRIIVIDHGGVDAKDFPDTDGGSTVWTKDHPGVLIVLGGDMDQTGQKKSIYGVVYLADGILLRGNAEIHGMCIAAGSADLRGTRAVNYNAEVIANLNRPQVLSVKLVQNTWREIQP
jgi:type II secretory pathway pseudopilin PulG